MYLSADGRVYKGGDALVICRQQVGLEVRVPGHARQLQSKKGTCSDAEIWLAPAEQARFCKEPVMLQYRVSWRAAAPRTVSQMGLAQLEPSTGDIQVVLFTGSSIQPWLGVWQV